jgi:predicted Zn-dependent peptidase
MFQKTTLKNGLRVITVPLKNTQAVTVLALVGVGSKYEKKEINGISHFLEHMFFKGTKKRPTHRDIAETLDKIGGEYNAFTGEDYTGYYARVEASHIDLALDWVSDILLNSTLPSKQVEKEKKVIIEEINMYLDNPMIYVQSLWRKVLYGDQPAGRDIAGSKQIVKAITRQKLINYRKSHYIASNALVCVAGKIDSQELLKKVEKCFYPLNKAEKVQKAEVKESQKEPRALLYYKKTDQTHLCLGVRAYNLFHPDRYVLQVLATLLGGMMSSRMFLEVREKLGLSYYVATGAEIDPDTGFLMTRAGVDNKNVKKAVKAILREYKKISQEKPTEKELQKAKNYLKGKTALSLETSEDLASFYSIQEILKSEILTPKQILQEIEKVTTDDILRVAKDIFTPQKLNLAMVGPFCKRKEFESLLKDD